MINLKKVARALAVVLAILGAGSVAAQNSGAEATVPAAITEVKERLELSPDQEAQLKPLVEARRAELKAIRDKYAGDTSRRARRAMFREARPVIENYQARVRTILTDTQRAEWEKMREEGWDQLKKQYKKGTGPE